MQGKLQLHTFKRQSLSPFVIPNRAIRKSKHVFGQQPLLLTKKTNQRHTSTLDLKFCLLLFYQINKIHKKKPLIVHQRRAQDPNLNMTAKTTIQNAKLRQ